MSKTGTPKANDVSVKRRKLSDYILDPHNANAGSQRGASMLETSIEQFGPARSGVVDRNGVMRAGNHTAEQLAAAGIEDVIEVEADGKSWVVVKRVDMDMNTGKRYAVADNRTGELIEWNASELQAMLDDGLDLEQFFDRNELDALLNKVPDIEFPEYDETASDDVKYCTCPNCGHKFPK